MKLTQILYKQHIGRQRRLFWYIMGKRTLIETLDEKKLTARGINIIDAKDAIPKPKIEQVFDFKSLKDVVVVEQPLPLDNTHPDWHDRPCLTYHDNDLLTLGLEQAQQITKTVVFKNQLPDAVESLTKDISVDMHNLVKRIVETSVIFDAHQEKLPKVKDPIRPQINLPRVYGITDVRKISNLSKKMIQLCEGISGPEVFNARSILDDAVMKLQFEKEFDLYQLKLTMDMIIMSKEPLKAAKKFDKEECENMEMPNLHPIHHAIGLTEENIYKTEDLYPLTTGHHEKNIHTIIVYHDPSKVKHKSELSSNESQIFGRALMKVFTASASAARKRFGSDVKELPEPVTVQCIHSNGKRFYFSVYQLNTLDLEGVKGLKNYCWTLPALDLYKTGGYVEGKPILDGYNPEVFQRMLAFYKNN